MGMIKNIMYRLKHHPRTLAKRQFLEYRYPCRRIPHATKYTRMQTFNSFVPFFVKIPENAIVG